MLNACIIDDEIFSAKLLEKLLNDYLTNVHVQSVWTNPVDALRTFSEDDIDIVFLDMDMPEMRGLELLKMLPPGTEKKTICLTGHEKFAIQALRAGVRNYLLKPLTASVLTEAIDKFIADNKKEQMADKPPLGDKIFINRHDRAFIVNIDEILFLEADGPYCIFHMHDKSDIRSSKPIGFYKKMLDSKINFVSVHRSYIVNFNHIKEIVKDDQGEGVIMMSNGENLEFSNVSKNKLIQFIQDVLSGNG